MEQWVGTMVGIWVIYFHFGLIIEMIYFHLFDLLIEIICFNFIRLFDLFIYYSCFAALAELMLPYYYLY